MSGVQLIFEISTRNSQEATRLNEDFVVYRMTNANDALYIAIDFISQSILVDVLDIQFFSRLIFLNEALLMLNHVAPTIGYPMHFTTCVLRC